VSVIPITEDDELPLTRKRVKDTSELTLGSSRRQAEEQPENEGTPTKRRFVDWDWVIRLVLLRVSFPFFVRTMILMF
jgi:hypothetical protein